jgi:hypothetical protein
MEIHVRPFQGHDLPAAQPRFPAEQNNQPCLRIVVRRVHETLEVLEVMETGRWLWDRQQANHARHPLNHVQLDRLLEEHVQHGQHVVDRLRFLRAQTVLEPLDLLCRNRIELLGAKCWKQVCVQDRLLRCYTTRLLTVGVRVTVNESRRELFAKPPWIGWSPAGGACLKARG